jgi:hypothetical protein
MDQSKTFTNDNIIGKSLFKNDKKENKAFFERSILNLMIINNYNEKQKNKVFKKELNNNGYI